VLYCNDTSNLSRGVLLYDDSNLESSEVSFDSIYKEFAIVKIEGANGVHLTVIEALIVYVITIQIYLNS